MQLWYPAQTTNGFRRARYRNGRQSGWRDANLALVQTRSFVDAPLAQRQRQYPVLLFSGPFNRFQNTFETEEMASHGFIVVGIDHTYDGDLVVLPDGRRISGSKGSCLLDFTSARALALSRPKVERRLAVRVADTLYVLDRLNGWNEAEGNPFFGRLDLSDVGMFGHSFGGAVAAEVCRVDPRVRAGVNMDGSIFGSAKRDGVPKPFLTFFTSARPAPSDLAVLNEPRRRENLELAADYAAVDRSLNRYGGYFLQVPGMEHMNFSDYSLYSQVRAWTDSGPISARKGHEAVNRITLAFFQHELLHDHAASVEAAVHDVPGTLLRRQTGTLPLAQ